MKDWKTTVTALIGIGVWLAAKYGLHIPADIQIQIVAVTIFFIGLFARDGGTKDDGTH